MVGIIFINDIKYCPYLSKYKDTLDKLKMDYEVVYWNRNPQTSVDSYEQHHDVIELKSQEEMHPFFKLKDFLRFSRFAKEKIKERNYEKIIILTSLTGIFLHKTLFAKYRGNYIFDYRDASYEYLRFYRKIINRLVSNSYFTCISSKGFLDILPKSGKYIMAHNFKYSDLKYKANNSILQHNERIQLSYIGLLREKYLFRLIDIISNDNRFLLSFHGSGECLAGAMRHAEGIENIIFTGEYKGDEKIRYVRQADILCYNYESSFINDKALANKYYDALIFKKPLLGDIHTYSGQLIKENGLGVSLDLNDPEYTNKLYDYYINLDRKTFDEDAESALKKVLAEDAVYMQKIEEFFLSRKLKS